MIWLFACIPQSEPVDSAVVDVTSAFAADAPHRYVQIDTEVGFDVGESTGVEFLIQREILC